MLGTHKLLKKYFVKDFLKDVFAKAVELEQE